jgi:hypothetical protein
MGPGRRVVGGTFVPKDANIALLARGLEEVKAAKTYKEFL